MKKIFLSLITSLALTVTGVNSVVAQCGVTNTGTGAAPTCSNQSMALGAGESRNLAFTSGWFYDFSFANNVQSNGMCIGTTQYTSAVTLNNLSGTVAVGMYRNSTTWNSTSATFTYRLSTPTTPGTPSIASNGCTGVTVQWAAASYATAYDVQVATNSGFTTFVAGNNCGGAACDGTISLGNVTSVSITGLTAGTTYYVRVRARNGGSPCYGSYSAALPFTTASNASISSVSRTDNGTYCIGGSGTVTVTPAGGTGSYSYAWGGSGSGSSASSPTSATNNSTAGAYTYSVTVTPSGTGCAAASTSTTMTSYADPVVTAPTGSDALCKGGSLTLGGSASGGVPSAAFTYFWQYSSAAVTNNTPNGFTYSGTQNLTIATANGSTATPGAYNYVYYVTQAQSGCQSAASGTGTLTLANDPTAVINAPYGGTANCVPQSGVTMGVTVSGGVSQVYNWQRYDSGSWTNVQGNNSNYTTGTLTNASTLYQFTFTGGNGCNAVTTPTTELKAIPSVPTIPGGTTQAGCGQVVVGASPGAFGTTCRFYNGFVPNGSPSATGTSYSYSTPGSYTLYVTSYNPTTGCESSTYATVTVTVSPSFTSTTSTSNYNGYGVSCIGGTNGTATVNVTGAATPISYGWSNGSQTLGSGSSSNTISSLAVGNYTVTVTDANNCVVIENVSLSSPTAISSTITTSNNSGYAVSCNGGSNGTATVAATGGVGTYTYVWQGGGTSATRTNYAAGTYNVTVTDANGCNHVNSINITEPTAVSYTYSVGYVCSGSTYSSANIVINAAGGTGNYQYSITNGGSWQASNTFSGLASGSYTLRVKDVNTGTDCIAAGQTITVTIPSTVQASESCGYTYATANGGDPSGTFATPSCPVTLARALYLVTNDASFASRKHIIVTSGNYTLSGPVLIPADVVIDGGYDNSNAAQWVKNSSGITSITINSSVETATQSSVTVGFVRGFVVNGNNVQFKDLTINVNTTSPVTGTTSNRGRSVYGIYADGKTGTLVSRCVVNTGAGSAGDAGPSGASGVNGANGGAASPSGGCNDSPYQNGAGGGGGGTVSWGANGGTGGAGGFSEEGNAGDGATGGFGVNNTGYIAYGGGRGSNGGSCGTGGNASSGTSAAGGATDNNISTVATAGTDYNISSPAGASHTFGTFYLPSGQASQGGHGRAGDGGGGGGGTQGENTDFYCPYDDNSGNPGAGGGGGGAGGQGGYGGFGGGGSFPVYFSGGSGNVTDCALNPSAGGAGGVGGLGGPGGYGGGGGGGSCYCSGDRACSGSGGAGGNGARGGRGQTGATGAAQGFTTTNSSTVVQNGTSIPNPTTVTAAWTQGCRRSEITLTKSTSGATWDNLGSGANNPILVNNVTSSTTSYNNTQNSIKVYYGASATAGAQTITVSGQNYSNYIRIVGDRAYGDPVINSITAPCASGTITLGTTTAGANVAEYDWSVQLLSSPTVNLLSYTSQNPGAVSPVGGWTVGATYQVKLRVRENCCGWSVPTYTTFTVLTPPSQPSVITEVDPIVCANQNGASYSVTNVAGLTYTWAVTSGSGSIASGQGTNAVTVNWGAAGAATLQVTPVSACGSGTPRTLNLTVNANPVANISPVNPTFCAGASQVLTGTATAGTGGNGTFTYVWSTSSTNNTITVSSSNTYSLTVTEGASGCSAVGATIVTVNPLPTPSISGTPTVCNGNSTTLTASGGASYAWSTGAATAAISVSPTSNTTYTVTATSGAGCTATSSQLVTVNSLPTPGISGSTAICNGNSTTLTASGGTSYAWSTGPVTAAISVSPTSNTTYTVTVTNSNNCTASTSVGVTVNALPTTSPTASPTAICNGGSTTLNAGATAGSGTISSYAWSAGLGNVASGSVSPTGNTTYTVTVTNSNTCTASNSVAVTVNPLPTPSISGTATICSGGSTILTASGGTGYAWSTGPVTAAITVSPTTNTTYTVTVTNANSCTASTSQLVTVSPAPTVDAGNNISSCTGMSAITMTGATAGGSYSANTWTGGAGLGNWSQNANPALATFTPTVASGSFTATLSLTGSGGCSNTSDTRTVSWNSSITGLTATFDANPICEGLDVTLNAGVTSGTVTTWSWSGPNSYSASGQSAVVTAVIAPDNEGVYTVTATNACGTSTASTASLNVHANIIGLTASYVSAICEGSDLALTASYIGGPLPSTDVTWTWSGPGGFSSSVQNPTRTNVQLSGAGIYEVSATNACGVQSGSGPGLQVDAAILADADPNMLAAPGLDNGVIEACGTLVVNLQANDPTPGTGQWSMVPNSMPNTGSVVSFSPSDNSTNVTVTYSNTDPLPVSFRWTITNGVCPPTESDVRVVFDPAINVTAQTQGCSFTSSDSILVMVNGTGGSNTLSFGAPAGGELRVDVNAANKAFTVPMDGNSHSFPVSDGICVANQSVTVPASHPMDVAYNIGTGTTTASCYQSDFNKWTTYSDGSNGAILSINDNGQDLGQVNVTVYKDAAVNSVPQSLGGDGCTGYNSTAMQRHFMVTAQNTFSSPVGVRVYFTDAELQALVTASQANDVPGDQCSQSDNIYDINGLYLTKYTGANEDGDYTNNLAGGLYRVFGDATSLPAQPDGPMNKSAGGFGTIYSGAQAHHYAELSVTEFSELWLHGSQTGTALPVEMLFLEANAVNNSYIEVKWATILEINNNGFQVERSTDGASWTAIGWVDGNGDATVRHDYKYDDNTAVPGVRYYYRLKQIDNDGAFEYTGVVSAIINVQVTFSIKDFMPNPAMSTTNLVVLSNNAMDVEVSFYNVIGEVMMTGKYQLNKGSNTVTFDLEKLAAGTYTAVLSSANEVYSKKLVVVK